MKRRELFSSIFSFKKEEKETIVRVPYFQNIESFYEECPQCVNTPCMGSCPLNIIVLTQDKTPKIDFSKSGCTYCDQCAVSCPSGVLRVEYKKQIDVKIEIDILKCMSWHQTMCFSCKEPCLDDAISFLGMFRPSIDGSKCTACGFCIGVCPSQAIVIKQKEA